MIAARTNTYTDAYRRRFSPTRCGTVATLLRARSVYDEATPNYDCRDVKPEKPRRGSSEKFSAIVPRHHARKSATALGLKCHRLRRPHRGYQFWDFENYLAETDDQNEIQAVYTNEPQSYSNLISQYRKGPTIWTPSYHQYDVLGSTRLTGDGGDASDTYVYDAWGNEVAVAGSTVNPFRWVGQVGYYFDDALGTFYVRARVYEPVIARWMSQDPLQHGTGAALIPPDLGNWSDSRDLYGYGRGNPLTFTDPLGLQAIDEVPNMWKAMWASLAISGLSRRLWQVFWHRLFRTCQVYSHWRSLQGLASPSPGLLAEAYMEGPHRFLELGRRKRVSQAE